MNKFVEAIKENADWKKTENGAIARETSGSKLVDLFAMIGSMRERDEVDIIRMWEDAYHEDPNLAVKMAFYAGDAREGLGERRTFRTLIHHLAVNHPIIMRANIWNIPFYNRWDSMYEMVGTPCEELMWEVIAVQWVEDSKNMKEGKPISLMAKWLKSPNTSSKESRELGRKTAKILWMSEATYRKALSKFRAYLKVVEKSMSAKEWEKIQYNSVPAYAMKRYRDAFYRNDGARFGKYCDMLKKKMADGTISQKDIKSGVMYPHDLVREYFVNQIHNSHEAPVVDTVIEAQWKALPDYVGEETNVLVMADVSGSMMSPDYRPISASIGLASYFASHNVGAFHNVYMTFTDCPHYITIDDNDTLATQVYKVLTKDVGYSTDLEDAFDYILATALENRVPQKDMPKALVVISDNEIDCFARSKYYTDFLTEMEERFNDAGYECPVVVFWDVSARSNTFHAKFTNSLVRFVSGYSANSFKTVISSITKTAYETMRDTLMDERYSRVVC